MLRAYKIGNFLQFGGGEEMARPLKARGAIQIQRARPAAELQKIQFLYNCFQKVSPARIFIRQEFLLFRRMLTLRFQFYRKQITFHFEFLLLK